MRNNVYKMDTFEGRRFRLAENWNEYMPVTEYNNRPIKYLEIGAFHGANALSVAETYAAHPQSKIHCVDPWMEYNQYDEYKGDQPTNYQTFLKNISRAPYVHKFDVNRGFSHTEVPKFPNECFDIIYIDGNHETEYVLEDAVLSFRKLKKDGVMIFDDCDWSGPRHGADTFVSIFKHYFNVLGEKDHQLFLKKTREFS